MDKPIIRSILDNDLYKFTIQQAVLDLFPEVYVKYGFINRGKHKFNSLFASKLQYQVNLLPNLSLTDTEYSYLKENIPFLKPLYLEYLRNYRLDPNEVKISFNEQDGLNIEISGKWHKTILWEVVLMALVSESYFKVVDVSWFANDCTIEEAGDTPYLDDILADQEDKAYDKAARLSRGQKNEDDFPDGMSNWSAKGCVFADFGTRRRRSWKVHNSVMASFDRHKRLNVPNKGHVKNVSTFIGTSNVYFAMKYNVKPIGTHSHEWFQAMSVLEGLRHANYFGLTNWKRVYTGNLGIALPDTYGTDAFFKDFSLELSKLYDGVRHDSGDPFYFTEKVIAHYKSLGIDPSSKTIVFSDSLNVELAIELKNYCCERIQCSFGIGTHFTNDIEGSPALNMVIKMCEVMGVPVVKLGDGVGKTCGDPDAIKVAQWTFFGIPLNRDITMEQWVQEKTIK